MGAQPTYEDANLILRLYELRREEKLRKARQWFMEAFNARTLDDLEKLCPWGSETNAYFRMVVGYWDMAASFVTSGVLNEELFFQTSGEFLAVWEKIRELIPQYRERMKHQAIGVNMEKVANAFIQWMNSRDPEAYSTFQERFRAVSAAR